ncbi:MAG: N-acetylmuramoyl-L-alanine amidase [Methanobrevibacter sp.]|nr:N-acetylmuramoyl-L-alanine amidase [Methanobrevibacter sp.]
MIILIDNGHGNNTIGKASPVLDFDIPKEFVSNNRFREALYNRVIANKLVDRLKKNGYDARLVVFEDRDVSLSERVRRINTVCNREGVNNVILISIHSNACGNGTSFSSANGWEAYTTRGKTKSDKIADCLYKRAKMNFPNKKIRTDWTDGDIDKEADFYIIKKTKCAAVLTENFFYDNKEELKYLTSEEGVEAVVKTHYEGIIDYLKE